MSYDLMVFNPRKAPQSETEFLKWYDQQVEWKEPHNYVDPIVTTNELHNWFKEIIQDFPALSGPCSLLEADDMEGAFVTDYSIGNDVIYASFRWSVAEKAYTSMLELAEKHQVGFFDVSGSGDILFPNGKGGLDSIIKQLRPTRSWWKIWKIA